MNLRGVDLNLLVVFDALMAERHLTRAGQRIALSQPAMSAALARLRQLLGDDLFIRSANGMQPTRRAVEIAPAINQALQNIETTLARPVEFNPAESQQTFRLGMIDFLAFAILPKLIASLNHCAPGISLQVIDTTGRSMGEMLEDVSLDLAIGKGLAQSQQLCSEVLFKERFVSITRRDNGIDELDLEKFISLPHVLVAPRGYTTGIVDNLLAQQGLQRYVVAVLPHFLVVPAIVMDANAIATIPASIATRFQESFALAIHETPVKMGELSVAQTWHRRNDNSPGHQWLRQQIKQLMSTI